MFKFSHSTAPALRSIGLTEGERDLIAELFATGQPGGAEAALCRAFYLGQAIIRNLRIAVPKEVESHLDTVAGWPSVAVDPMVERLGVDGFRLPDSDDTDEHLSELMTENGMDAELPLAFTDALSTGAAFFSVGSPAESGYAPVVTVDSPMGTLVKWDLRGRSPRAALQQYEDGGRKRAVLLLPKLSIHLEAADNGSWDVVARDEHGFDFVPIVRMANMPLSDLRHGRSEITPAIRSHTVSASRSLRALDFAGELYGAPQKIIRGAVKEAFEKGDGQMAKAIETYLSSVLILERDDEGNLPEVDQATVYDPSVYTKVIDMHAARVAGLLAAVPQDLGLYTEGNPPSSEGQRASEMRRDRKARVRQKFFNPALVTVMQHALRFENNGSLPNEYRNIAIDWELDASVLSADDVSKLGDHIPAGSDVVLKKLGFNAVERRQMAADARRARVSAAANAVTARMTQEAANASVNQPGN